MIKRLELIGPSCLTSAADDEPIFVLKSTDELAPSIVREGHSGIESKRLGTGTIGPRSSRTNITKRWLWPTKWKCGETIEPAQMALLPAEK